MYLLCCSMVSRYHSNLLYVSSTTNVHRKSSSRVANMNSEFFALVIVSPSWRVLIVGVGAE
jgi:hypothetical protein